jgi:hypothetical protein
MAIPMQHDPDKPSGPGDEPQPPPSGSDAPRKLGRSRRGELEAQQKHYMDQRFGRDRPMTRKSPS